MKYPAILFVFLCLLPRTAAADSFQQSIAPLIKTSCLACHAEDTETNLNLAALEYNLSDKQVFGIWEKVLDRVRAGEMPPKTAEPLDPEQQKTALNALHQDLLAASLANQQKVGRVPARRLTKLELGYTLRDLLRIEGDVTRSIPDEVEAGSFDNVGSTQRISAVHMESYLQAADAALGLAINLRRQSRHRSTTDFAWLEEWHEKPANLGGSITRKLASGNGIALFRDVDYLTSFRVHVTTPGIHRLTAKAAAYQSEDPVTAKLIVKNRTGEANLIHAIDLEPGKPATIVVDTFLRPGDTPYLTFDMGGVEPFGAILAAGGTKNYRGRGIAIMSQECEGPLFDSWPPSSSRELLRGLKLADASGDGKGPFKTQLSQNPLQHVAEIAQYLAPRAFRRPPEEKELQPFIDLAKPAIQEERDFLDVLQVTLRAMLSSPQFLLLGGEAGPLDDYALAERLSYFLWKSLPDEELFALAHQNQLSTPDVLAAQVERMLADEKSHRMVQDFLGQWLMLYQINATTPDESLYPEYDELLGKAIPTEPELFFAELIHQNLSLANLIDSEFTFLNRRLAEHYAIPNITGQHFRRVELPAKSPRGGLLTQAAILKTTANGTTTSPVTRGNFVLTNFLGTPPPPPPPAVGSIEPDTRGKTTIREILAAHRTIETCNQCHREIDPPGFALENFDPIGGFRTTYRASGGGLLSIFSGKSYGQGPAVDPSGITADGKPFSGIEEFKQHLLAQQDQIAKHFISQLLVYATGGEIEFADRAEIDVISERSGAHGFRLKDIFHAIVQSKIFRNK